MNVKPGDIAKFVRGPECNRGRLVLVVKPWTGRTLIPWDWECQALQPIWIDQGDKLAPAGSTILCFDHHLQQIDPPSTDEVHEVLRELETAK